ncbi:hypothetical protein SALBM311S_03189 [Streptomyces alboniger]
MRDAGLEGRHRRRRRLTTIPDPRAAARPDLVVRNFAPDPDGLDTRWCGDITYVATDEGRLYLATVIDTASRRVVGWSTADHLQTELVADALQSACRERRPARPVIFHSDRGCPVHKSAIRHAGNRVRRPPVRRPHRSVLGQRARRVVLRHHQTRVARHEPLAQPGRGPHRDLRLLRGLVQLAPTAQQPRLPQSRRIRDRTRSLTTTPMVSVKAEQAQDAASCGNCPASVPATPSPQPP